MCAVNRVLMRLPGQQKKDPEMGGLLSEGGWEDTVGTECASKTQVLPLRVS